MPPCIPLPKLPIPTLPSPFSLTLPLPPPPSIQENVCCQGVNLGDPSIPFPLPPLILNPGVVVLIRNGAQIVSDYLRSLPIDCPKD